MSGEDEELGSEEVLPSDEEEERGSSAEEGSDEDDGSDDEGSDEDEEEGSDDNDGGAGGSAAPSRSRGKKRKFVMPPPRALPSRTTRGARMGKAEAEEGDEEFWNQEFFAEEANDDRYETESEPEDRFDADFNESEQEGDEDEEAAEAEAEAVAREKKKKALKPPGYTRPPLPKPRVNTEGGDGGGGGGPARGAGAPKQRRPSVDPADVVIVRRTVRDSTRQKVEEAEMERKMAEKYKPKRAAPRSSAHRQLTQAELLAEAAKTELENTKSLQLLEAIELEHRQRANVVKRRYAGPMVRWKSRRVGDTEVTTIEVRNMSMPGELQRRLAPAPAPPEVCAVTGQPARYRDPATGLPYATLEAFKELRRRRDADLLGGSSMGGMDGTLQQQAAAAPGSGTRYSTRHAAAAAPSPLQYMPLQQQLYQPELLLAQAGQPAGHAGAAAPGSVMDGQQAAGATFGGVT
ncbi:SWR1 complex subunit 2-like [Micractinium conductrix]|uniref:SWR1 complex subunit 2-like n=1 Tax=Micractinium conductrix TaxID=554055 RepID=A0A2P6V8K7_9CHLO|nr:SWR1 complex subunit 2-like [Micractinium conductrix]|eukprot:PSC70422.1 SWR1 complex subunit 2-like [Micractinium conductrix]